MTPHSSGSFAGLNVGTLPAFSYSAALCTNSVASPPSSTISEGPLPSGHTRHSTVHHQYSSSVSPFHANTGMPCGLSTVPPVSGTADHHRRGGVILRREDVARHPAHVGAEQRQRLDQHAGLNGHVQAAHDAGAGQRLLALVPLADRHQAGHLALGQPQLLAAELGQAQVGHLERNATRLLGQVVCVRVSLLLLPSALLSSMTEADRESTPRLRCPS